MLLVYYLYDYKTTVSAAGYGNFPIKGYDLYKFNDESNKLNLDETLKVYEDARINEKMYELNNSLEKGKIARRQNDISTAKFHLNNVILSGIENEIYARTLHELAEIEYLEKPKGLL